MKVLIANRGEIAVRVIRACRELGWPTVAVYSECDREAPHVRLADEAAAIGASPAAESYLNIARLVDAARRHGATFVHPGYGFLAENAEFAEACQDAGLTFVGPSPEAIRRMGDKAEARRAAVRAGVPVVPGTEAPFGADVPDAAIAVEADRVGYPLLVKAVAGGGGKGMRAVARREDLGAAIRAARSEARSAFGDSTVYLERRIVGARHIEIQLLADTHGTVVPFVERECSIQRRHQKVVEESPSLVLDPATRARMTDAAARLAGQVGYVNAGTMEFLVDERGDFFFLEMNTRLQVEHAVTEMVTGIDLVQWQFRIAAGDRLTVPRADATTARGHAIECRVYAEDPDRGFLPSPGTVVAMRTPGGPGVRHDSGVLPGFEIPIFYDSMIAKLVVWAPARHDAIRRLAAALDEYRIVGVTTTLPFFRWLVAEPAFLEGHFDTAYLDRVLAERRGDPFVQLTETERADAAVAAAIAAYLARQVTPLPDVVPPSGASAWRRAARIDGLR